MLSQLIIRNLGLIKEADIDFAQGFCAITGATGSGKSMLLDGLLLCLGERIDTGKSGNENQKIVTEAHFTEPSQTCIDWLTQKDIDLFDDEIILRREILPQGKSRCFVNDTPVAVNQLKELGKILADVHTQHAQMSLSDAEFPGKIVDACHRNAHVLNDYQHAFVLYKSLSNDLKKAQEEYKKQSEEEDYIQYLIKELENISIEPNEELTLHAEIEKLTHGLKIRETLGYLLNIWTEGDFPILGQLRESEKMLQQLGRQVSQAEALSQRIQSLRLELIDITESVKSLNEASQDNPERLHALNERLADIQRLIKKHKVENGNQLIEKLHDLIVQQSSIAKGEEKITALTLALKQAKVVLQNHADTLEKLRIKAIPKAENDILKMLKNTGLEKCIFEIRLTPLPMEDWNHGQPHKIDLYFSANPGTPAALLHKAASGGELSRIMLSIKTWMAGYANVPTLIFDEIDAGISGEIAKKVADTLKKTSQHHQVLAITHMPQIAAKANHHIKVEKSTDGNKTVSSVKILSENERVEELAEMIAGKGYSATAEKTAKEFLSAS